ncbi:hypothetical protein LR48_Vigan07g194200 [Vigna angularis]|uniref:Uncharacterized protein n=1 Tax=Phaseolus angularis TaxID=3914 RepID=A0A0L9UZM6_PHAAN|nr:hypothetical protein LR48_Vigan07g194200 [Vigna angularis]
MGVGEKILHLLMGVGKFVTPTDRAHGASFKSYLGVMAKAHVPIVATLAATGRLDRPGRVCAVGGAIGLRDYFGPKPRSTKVVTEEMVSSIRQQVQVELEESVGERFRIDGSSFVTRRRMIQDADNGSGWKMTVDV